MITPVSGKKNKTKKQNFQCRICFLPQFRETNSLHFKRVLNTQTEEV